MTGLLLLRRNGSGNNSYVISAVMSNEAIPLDTVFSLYLDDDVLHTKNHIYSKLSQYNHITTEYDIVTGNLIDIVSCIVHMLRFEHLSDTQEDVQQHVHQDAVAALELERVPIDHQKLVCQFVTEYNNKKELPNTSELYNYYQTWLYQDILHGKSIPRNMISPKQLLKLVQQALSSD